MNYLGNFPSSGHFCSPWTFFNSIPCRRTPSSSLLDHASEEERTISTYKSSRRFRGRVALTTETLINQANVRWNSGIMRGIVSIFSLRLVLLDWFNWNWNTRKNISYRFWYWFYWLVDSIDWLFFDMQWKRILHRKSVYWKLWINFRKENKIWFALFKYIWS